MFLNEQTVKRPKTVLVSLFSFSVPHVTRSEMLASSHTEQAICLLLFRACQKQTRHFHEHRPLRHLTDKQHIHLAKQVNLLKIFTLTDQPLSPMLHYYCNSQYTQNVMLYSIPPKQLLNKIDADRKVDHKSTLEHEMKLDPGDLIPPYNRRDTSS